MPDVQVAQSVNWWVVGGSSAVISALVNGAFKLWGDYTARRDERAKLAEQRAPAQLKVALMLEAFAKQAAGYVDGCEARIMNWYAEQEGDAPEALPEWTPLKIDMAMVEDWTEVPIRLHSDCQELPLALAASDAWIRAGIEDEWLDTVDAHRLDSQRAILYGFSACDLAIQIRSAIEVPASALSTDCCQRLQRELDRRRDEYVRARGRVELILDLKARFRRECPSVVLESDVLLTSAGS
ncbi:hypothetical protein [Burkholderia sp. 22PA0106]|uniref:hypothetical protein n=1 Tax=Burkholderia sp. 22PA0106 TaxID=3237371 RepID=UPI0039C185ED